MAFNDINGINAINAKIGKDSVSRGASLDERWSPRVTGRRHCRSHQDFPQEDRAMANPKSLVANLLQVQAKHFTTTSTLVAEVV